jgi:hypothetical protein
LDPADDNGINTPPVMYSLSLKGEGMAVERKIDEATALEVLALVMTGAPATDTTHGEKRERPRATERRSGRKSLREYLDEVGAKRNPDKIVSIAEYISEETGKNFTRDDVKNRFEDAAEPVPGNYGRDFQWGVRNGWIAPAATKGDYYVTDAGRKAIEAKFDAETKKKTGVSKGRRGGKRRVKKADAGE